MKRALFLKELTAKGCHIKRHGSRHDIFENENNGKIAPIPRHSEIKETLCMLIRKQLGI
ncbi:MAG: type II toxin-antitoxin system HicA family toxin [Brevinematales bacterium]|nr:type II toxin-antitoxin system HicA family toxin [Brevinematales bacterium]